MDTKYYKDVETALFAVGLLDFERSLDLTLTRKFLQPIIVLEGMVWRNGRLELYCTQLKS